MTVEVRPATPQDARAIAEIHVASWRWAYRDLLPASALDALSMDRREAMWRSWFASGEERAVLVVAEEHDAVIGFAGAGSSRDAGAGADTAEVRTIYLLEAASGRGIGRTLFAALTEPLRAFAYRRATLWVFEGNEQTRRFYEAAGWRPDGARDTYDVEGLGYPVVRYETQL